MTIKGNFQASRLNDYGYPSIKVSGTWYGSDKKGAINGVVDGDTVEFEAFEKPGKNGKTYPTYQFSTFKKVASAPAAPAPAPAGKSSYAQKEDYWAQKAKDDSTKEPRINYFAALDRAISFVDLALRNGAITAYAKAKDTGKLEVLTALVYETTQRLIAEAYQQKVPSAEAVTEVVDESTQGAGDEDSDKDWS